MSNRTFGLEQGTDKVTADVIYEFAEGLILGGHANPEEEGVLSYSAGVLTVGDGSDPLVLKFSEEANDVRSTTSTSLERYNGASWEAVAFRPAASQTSEVRGTSTDSLERFDGATWQAVNFRSGSTQTSEVRSTADDSVQRWTGTSWEDVSLGGSELPSFPSSLQVSSAAGTQPILEYFLDGDFLNTGSLGAAADMTPLAPYSGLFTGSTRSEKKLAAAAISHGVGISSGGRTPDLAALNINGPCSLFLCIQGASHNTQWLNSLTYSLAWIGRTGFTNETLFGLYLYGLTATLIFYTYDVGPILLDTGTLLPAGQRYNLVATRGASDGLNQQIRVYVNGREVLNQLASAQTTTAGNNFFDLGNAHSSNSMGQAVYDYAALWSVELTAPQVQAVNALFPIR